MHLPLYAPNAFACSELGRYSLDVFKRIKAIKYWLRINSLPDYRLPKLCYKMQLGWLANDTDCWAFNIKQLLFRIGFGEVWLTRGWDKKMYF